MVTWMGGGIGLRRHRSRIPPPPLLFLMNEEEEEEEEGMRVVKCE